MADEIDSQTRRPKIEPKRIGPRAGGGPIRSGDVPGPNDMNIGEGSRRIGAAPTYSRGGMVKKHGSPKVSAPCSDSKTLSCK